MAKFTLLHLKNYFQNKFYPYTHSDAVYTDDEEKITLTSFLKELSNKIESLPSGSDEGGTNNYPNLVNKPSINGVELVGNKTTSDLNISIPEIPSKISQLENDKGYITNTKCESLLNNKIDKIENMGLSENSYTNEDKNKLSAMPKIIFSNIIPESLEENTICFVYEEAEQ